MKSTTYEFGHFTIISGHFTANYMNIFHKNLGSNGHFEDLNMAKSQLNQKLQYKIQIFTIQFFFNFVRKKT